MASESFAIEGSDFTNYLRGATQGLPLGALPPPGIYGAFGLNATGLGPSPGKGNQTIPGAATAPSFGYGVSLLFVPGWTFLGATYGASVVQGMYLGTAESSVNPPFATSSVNSQLANTNITPISLSWNLSHGWFVAAAVTIVPPDGSQWHSTLASVDLNPYWTIAPGAAVSYLDANWLASANFRYDINTASRGVTMAAPFIGSAANGFISGNELFGDFTVLYKIGKWQIGPVAYFEAQTNVDRPGGGVACTPAICGFQSQVAVGGLVGYDFGPVAVQLWFDDTIECQNAVCGLDVWGRMSFRIWAPEAPKPLVAKN
jgi:Putative MetA-pathway of phenol degradation